MTIEIVHKYTSAGDKALELQYWGLGEPGTRLTLGGGTPPARATGEQWHVYQGNVAW